MEDFNEIVKRAEEKVRKEAGWREEFDEHFQTRGQAHHYEFCLCGEGEENKCEQEIKDFIETEIIEELIEDATNGGKDGILNHALRAKWLGNQN